MKSNDKIYYQYLHAVYCIHVAVTVLVDETCYIQYDFKLAAAFEFLLLSGSE